MNDAQAQRRHMGTADEQTGVGTMDARERITNVKVKDGLENRKQTLSATVDGKRRQRTVTTMPAGQLYEMADHLRDGFMEWWQVDLCIDMVEGMATRRQKTA